MTRVMLGLAEQSTAPTSYDSSLEQGSGVVAIAWHAVSKAWGHLQGEGEVSEQHDLHGHGRHLMARVAGVGVGTFLIFFFLAICILIILLGSRTKIRWVWYTISVTIFLIVFLVLVASPRGMREEKPPGGWDQTVVPMTVIMVLMCVGIVLGALGMLVFQGAHPVYARPLSYHLDVERRM